MGIHDYNIYILRQAYVYREGGLGVQFADTDMYIDAWWYISKWLHQVCTVHAFVLVSMR